MNGEVEAFPVHDAELHRATAHAPPSQATGRSAGWQWLPPILLLLITAAAWAIYAWAHWPHHWQSRLMHPLLFAPWTMAWHSTVRSSRTGWRLPLAIALLVPVVAALGGELIQKWWHAIGHDPEWGGAGFSLLGVGLGWLGLWVYRVVRRV